MPTRLAPGDVGSRRGRDQWPMPIERAGLVDWHVRRILSGERTSGRRQSVERGAVDHRGSDRSDVWIAGAH